MPIQLSSTNDTLEKAKSFLSKIHHAAVNATHDAPYQSYNYLPNGDVHFMGSSFRESPASPTNSYIIIGFEIPSYMTVALNFTYPRKYEIFIAGNILHYHSTENVVAFKTDMPYRDLKNISGISYNATVKSIGYLREIPVSTQLLNEFVGDGTMPLTTSKYPEEIGFIQTLQQLFKLTSTNI